MGPNFALIGAAGYVAPKHFKAIKEVEGNLVAALDPHDSVGILDSYFINTNFFTEFERFDRHIDKLRRRNNHINYVSICSPNYLHDAHIRFALRSKANAICEKPLVLSPWNLDALSEIEKETGKKIYTILQLRKHPVILSLREKYKNAKGKIKVELRYVTPRGNWYHHSWKGNQNKSGGIVTNIGIHLFDALLWIFGKPLDAVVNTATNKVMSGTLELERANVDWFLSIDRNNLINKSCAGADRLMIINGQKIDFSSGFSSLHTEVYKDILANKGLGIDDARPSIELTHLIRSIIQYLPQEQIF